MTNKKQHAAAPIKALLGRKIGMTQVWDADGHLGPPPGHVVCQPPQRQRGHGRSGREGRLTGLHDWAFTLERPVVLTRFRPVRHRIGQPCGFRTV